MKFFFFEYEAMKSSREAPTFRRNLHHLSRMTRH